MMYTGRTEASQWRFSRAATGNWYHVRNSHGVIEIMMQSSFNRFVLRSIASNAKVERYLRYVAATDTTAGCRTFAATASPWNRTTPLNLTTGTTTPIQRQVQAIRCTSSSADEGLLKESYEYIQVDATTHPGVAIVTLHRPKALNALCDGLFADLIHAATALDKNYDDIGCIVLTGSTKAFAAGADISEMKDRTFDFAYTKVRTYRESNFKSLLCS